MRCEGRVVVLRILYDGTVDEPPQWGDAYTIAVPEKAPRAAAWYEAQAHFRAQLPPLRSEEQRVGPADGRGAALARCRHDAQGE